MRRSGATPRRRSRSRKASDRTTDARPRRPSSDINIERDVEIGRRMGDPAGRGVINAGAGNFGNVVERDPARGPRAKTCRATICTAFRMVAASMLSSSTASAIPILITSPSSSRVSTSISILTRWPAAALRTLEHRPNAARDRNMIVLDQDRIIEPETMVESTAAAHGVFLERAQPRCRLARAADAHAGAGHPAHELVRRRGHAGEMAEQVEGHPFGRKHGAGGTCHGHQERLCLRRLRRRGRLR